MREFVVAVAMLCVAVVLFQMAAFLVVQIPVHLLGPYAITITGILMCLGVMFVIGLIESRGY